MQVRELCEGASTGAFALFGLRLRIIGEGASWGGVLGRGGAQRLGSLSAGRVSGSAFTFIKRIVLYGL